MSVSRRCSGGIFASRRRPRASGRAEAAGRVGVGPAGAAARTPDEPGDARAGTELPPEEPSLDGTLAVEDRGLAEADPNYRAQVSRERRARTLPVRRTLRRGEKRGRGGEGAWPEGSPGRRPWAPLGSGWSARRIAAWRWRGFLNPHLGGRFCLPSRESPTPTRLAVGAARAAGSKSEAARHCDRSEPPGLANPQGRSTCAVATPLARARSRACGCD